MASKTGGFESWPAGVLSLRSSGCGNVTNGGDLAARSRRSLQGLTARGLSAARAAKLSKKSLKPRPSNVAWFIEMPIEKPPHLNEVTCTIISLLFINVYLKLGTN